jgi:hypothetical protein
MYIMSCYVENPGAAKKGPSVVGTFIKASLILISLTMSVSPLRAATWNAASVSQSDVAAAIASAAAGDTVQIPAGTATWSGSVTVNKAITVAGAGTNSTQISGAGFVLKPGVDKLTRLTGIHFYQSSWTPQYIVNCVGNCKQFRIDHCKFSRGFHVLNFNPNGGTGATGPAFGVVDHNTFYNPNVAVFVVDVENGDGQTWGSQAWARPLTPGTTNSVVIEDNVFFTDNEINGSNNNQMLYGFCGGRATFRHNIHTATGSYGITSIDAHGEYAAASGLASTVMFEVYSNTFNINSIEQIFTLRGGRHIWFDNKITAGGGGGFIQLWDEVHLLDFQTIQASYFWNNTFNGSVEQGPLPVNPTYPYTGQMNVQYFMHAPQPGQTFYPYVALIYPHPLVGPSAPQTNPVTKVSPGSLEFALEPNTGSTNQTVTVSNVGVGTLNGNVSITTTSSPSPWSIVGSTSYSVRTNTSATITLRYTPTTAADSYATLNFTDNGGGAAVTVVGGRPKTYIWPIGDSLTQGHDVPGGYRLPLYQILTGAGVSVAFVGNTNDNSSPLLPYPNHDGYGGYEISDLAPGIPGWRANIRAPDYVLLMVGLNDFRHNDDIAHATNRLENLIVEIATNAPTAKIVVADLNPWVNLGVTNAAMETYYNPYIPGIVARQASQGRKVYLCDMRGKILPTDLESDNTHCTQSGYNKMATNWYGTLTPLMLLNVTKPPPPGNFRVAAASP